MSINLENPETVLGKVDAAANFVAQIRLAMMVGDGVKAMGAVIQAERLLFAAQGQIEEQEDEPPHAHLVRHLRWLNSAYEANVKTREELPPDELRFKAKLLQEEADHYCGEIMRTERKIITALLAEAPPEKPYGYNCAVCGEPIVEPQATEHTDEGLAHAECCVAGRAAAEGSADGNGESKSGAGSASGKLCNSKERK